MVDLQTVAFAKLARMDAPRNEASIRVRFHCNATAYVALGKVFYQGPNEADIYESDFATLDAQCEKRSAAQLEAVSDRLKTLQSEWLGEHESATIEQCPISFASVYRDLYREDVKPLSGLAIVSDKATAKK